MNKIIVLIPSYEPDDKLIKLVDKLTHEDLDIVVVNDGSGKEYNKIFNELKSAKVISYSTNKGKGHALKTGYKYIKEHYKSNYVVVTMDSDGQHDIKDALKLCNAVMKDKKTFYIGKRKISKNTPLRSRFGNTITRFVYHIVSKIHVYDTQTGLRAFSDELMDFMIGVKGERFEYEMNVLLECPLNGIDIKELEIKVIYIDNNSGSHFDTIKDSYKVYKEIFKYISVSFMSFLLDYSLYVIISLISNNIVLSNVLARIASGTFNFTLNKNLVFKSKNKTVVSFIQYVLLAVIILLINTYLLNYFVNVLGANRYIIKLVIELALSIISWSVQKFIIFRNRKSS